MLPEDGAQGAFGAEAFVKIHLVHHKTFFSAGPGQRGTARCASQGTETQALLPKQQTPSRSRLRENFTQTLPRDLRYSWRKARHFLLSSCSLRAHLQEVSQPQRWAAAVPGWLRTARCWADLCIKEQTLRKLSCRPRQKVTEQACSKVWHSLKEDVAT